MATHCFLWVLLLVILMPWVAGMNLGVKEDDESSTNSSSRVLVALNYPSIRIGPYSWRYFRVEVPQAFAELSISLTRKWTGEHIGNLEAKVPMVCFRFGSPPLPNSILESPQAAAMAAGKSENLSGTGECAWFHANSSIALTNMQVVAGVWYVGVFSDSQPSRFQSKMITRGNIFTFGIHFTVFGCKAPNLRGHSCDVTVKPLCYQTSISGLNSVGGNKQSLETILMQQGLNFANDISNLNRPSTSDSEEAWISLLSEHIGPKAWKYYALEIVDFPLKLQVRGLCKNCNLIGLNETREGSIYLKYGALPEESDHSNALDLALITIPVPRRGLWYIGVHNINLTQSLDFDLYWRVESCSYGSAADSCASAINAMERVLVEDTDESPFNSFYGPTNEENVLHSPWFLLSTVTNLGNSTSGNWTYFFIEVPRGASGAVLSLQLRHVIQATTSVYARLEGLATPKNWDIKAMNMEENERISNHNSISNFTMKRKPIEIRQQKNNRLSLDIVYPAEGFWCIGVHYVKHFAFVDKTSLKDIPQEVGIGKLISIRFNQLCYDTSKTIVQWYQSFVELLGRLWNKICSTMYLCSSNRTQEKAFVLLQNLTNKDIDTISPNEKSLKYR